MLFLVYFIDVFYFSCSYAFTLSDVLEAPDFLGEMKPSLNTGERIY